MVKCSFCGNELPKGSGKMFVKKTGQIFYFCSSKCEKNQKLGRAGKHVRWTKTYEKLKKENQ